MVMPVMTVIMKRGILCLCKGLPSAVVRNQSGYVPTNQLKTSTFLIITINHQQLHQQPLTHNGFTQPCPNHPAEHDMSWYVMIFPNHLVLSRPPSWTLCHVHRRQTMFDGLWIWTRFRGSRYKKHLRLKVSNMNDDLPLKYQEEGRY